MNQYDRASNQKLVEKIFNPKNAQHEGGRRNDQNEEKHVRSKSKPATSKMGDIQKKIPNKLNFIRRRDLGQEQKKSAKSVDAQGRRMVLHRLSNGNIPAYAAGPLKRERYINPKMESELINFK